MRRSITIFHQVLFAFDPDGMQTSAQPLGLLMIVEDRLFERTVEPGTLQVLERP